MNWLDIVIALIVLTSLIGSIAKGLTRELVSLAAAVVGLLVALWWHSALAGRLEPYTANAAVAGFVAFVLILLLFLLLGYLVSKILVSVLNLSGLRWFDRFLGAAFGLVRGVLISAALVMAMVAFAPGKGPLEAVAGSRLAPSVMYGARAIVAVAPRKLKDSFQDGWDRIRKLWRESQTGAV